MRSMTDERPHRARPAAAMAPDLVVGLLLPLVAASVLVWSATDRQQKLDKIPVAIVNNDTILTDPQPMAAGRALTASLTDPSDPGNKLDWTLTDSDDAKTGCENGYYYAVLTIPSDFSQRDRLHRHGQARQGKLSW